MDNQKKYDPKAENRYRELTEDEQLALHIRQYQNTEASGLSIASLVLGICSIAACMGPTTGIPAIICGHLAMSKITRGEAGGKGMALTGLITGYIGTLFVGLYIIGILAAMLLPALSQAREAARKISCTNNLKKISNAITYYANDYNGQYPPYNGVKGLDLLRSGGYLDDPSVYVCPSCETDPAASGAPLTAATCDYDYIGGLNEDSSVDLGLACDKDNNHDNYGNILFVGGYAKGYRGYAWKTNMVIDGQENSDSSFDFRR